MQLDRLLEAGETVRVEGLLRLGENGLLLLHGLPQLTIAHQGHPEDLLVLEEEVVLSQHAQPGGLRHRHLALGGVQGACQDVQQRGLARAVGADQAVALPGVELEGDAGEERSVAEGLGEVRDGDHGGRNLAATHPGRSRSWPGRGPRGVARLRTSRPGADSTSPAPGRVRPARGGPPRPGRPRPIRGPRAAPGGTP